MVSVRFYEEEIRTLAGLPDEERGRIITAILLDSIGEPLPELAPMEQAVYNLIRGQVRRDKELSEKRQKSVSSRWEKDSEPEPQVQKNTNAIQNDTSVIQNDTNVIQKIQTLYKIIQTHTNPIQTHTPIPIPTPKPIPIPEPKPKPAPTTTRPLPSIRL